MSKFKSELVLKNLIGDKGLESLKKHVFHQDSQSPLTPLDLYLPLLVVPRAIMSWLVQNIQPMEVGEIKELKFPNDEEIVINIEKQGRDSYRAEFIKEGKVFHEFEKTNLPAIGGHLMTVGEMYDSFSDDSSGAEKIAEVPQAIMDISGVSNEIGQNKDSIAHISIKEFSNIIGKLIDALVSNNIVRNTISQALSFVHKEDEQEEKDSELEKDDVSESKQRLKQDYNNKRRIASFYAEKAEKGPSEPAGGAKPKAPKQPQPPVPRNKQPLAAQKKQAPVKAQGRLQTQQPQQKIKTSLPSQERGVLKEEINSYFRGKIKKTEELEKAGRLMSVGGTPTQAGLDKISATPRNQRTPEQQKIHNANVKATSPQTTNRQIAKLGSGTETQHTTGPYKTTAYQSKVASPDRTSVSTGAETVLQNKDATASMKNWYADKAASSANKAGDTSGTGKEVTSSDMSGLTPDSNIGTGVAREINTVKEELGVTEMEPTNNKSYFRNKLKKAKIVKTEPKVHINEHELYTPCIHCGVPEFEKSEDGQPKYKPCACFMVTLMSEEGNNLPFVQVVKKKESGYTLSFNPKADKETVEVFIETLKNRLLERKGRNK